MMDFERIETVLFNCRKALELLHPVMDPDEPCVVYNAYTEAGKLLIALEDFAQNVPDPHEIWAAAQLMPGEGIEDGVRRIAELMEEEE